MSKNSSQIAEVNFELDGENYQVVEPFNFESLMKALQIRDIIQTAISSSMQDEDLSQLTLSLQHQEKSIKTFLDSLGEFDNSTLINNISYLVKNNDLRIGEVENMIGLSAGYISRTAKEKSQKKLSIDVVWKIARFFEIDLKSLLETELAIPNSNSSLAIEFLEKASRDTEAGKLRWICNGGSVCELDESLEKEGLVTFENDQGNEVAIYHPRSSLNPEVRFVLDDDIYSCKNISPIHEVLIVPFRRDRSDKINYEILFRKVEEKKVASLRDVHNYLGEFTTVDDPIVPVISSAHKLYKVIKDREYDTELSSGVKSVMIDYVKTGKYT